VLYTAKCFWPGVTQAQLRVAVGRVADEGFRCALYLPRDELVLCVFESPSPTAVKQASEQAGLPCERVIETLWLAPDEKEGGAA
jgi:hypothetical protein